MISKVFKDPPRTSDSLKRVVGRHHWTILRYKRDAIPNYGWKVMQGTLVIMGELTKQAAQQLAEDHNRCLPTKAA